MLLAKNIFFWTFWRFSSWNIDQISSNLHTKTSATWHHTILSTTMAFYDIFAWAHAEIKTFEKVTYVFCLFSLFIIFFSCIFCCSDWPSTGLTSSWKNSQKASMRCMGNFYHGVATCRSRKFCSEFFNQISENFRPYFRFHWADHFRPITVLHFFHKIVDVNCWVWWATILASYSQTKWSVPLKIALMNWLSETWTR